MRLLKVTEEYRAESEQEVKEMNEQFKSEAKSEGYILNAFSLFFIWLLSVCEYTIMPVGI